MKALALLLAAFVAACGGDDRDTKARTLTVAELHPSIAKIYADPNLGSRCSAPQACNATVRVTCFIEADGPQTYHNEADGELVMRCGGACMAPSTDPKTCQKCPPEQWTCDGAT